ncbi:MAG: CBS protein [Gammaproteobacteria bacterium]|nr:CBS protein [Gammaproteobacteria bacterium]
MEREIINIPRITIRSGIACQTPDPTSSYVHENDPAVSVMTDFRVVNPITIEPNVSIDVALNKMKTLGVRLLLVTDAEDHIAGVITSYDIQGEKPVKYSEEHGISHDRINVAMLTVSLESIPAFDFAFIQQSLVRHVVTTFAELERPHALVIEFDKTSGRPSVRGMFSSTQISKLLGRSVYTPLHAGHSLADIQHEMEHPSI